MSSKKILSMSIQKPKGRIESFNNIRLSILLKGQHEGPLITDQKKIDQLQEGHN